MATYKTVGIILSRRNFFEADRLVTIYSKNYGKLKLLAKGSRKIKSRIGGRLEPFVLAELMVAEGRNFDIITSSEVIDNFAHLRSDLAKTTYAYLMAELVEKVSVEQQASEQLFNHLIEGLHYLTKHQPTALLNIYFSLKLISIIGFQPQLSRCVNCRRQIRPGQNRFSINLGGIICPACAEADAAAGPISDYQIKLLRLLLSRNVEIIKNIKPKKKAEIKTTKNLINQYTEFIIEKEIMSQKIINQINNIKSVKEDGKGKNGSQI
jgi:DNA repair protein RecO (recombination protein O)